ncbi:hypothetical protein [Oricola indica]|uniref:hypothetical protein n=1 Tax=Oricola indica TaxID=2872591 RepID=UPI003CCBA885
MRLAGFGAVTLEMARNEMAGYAIFHGGLASRDRHSWSSAVPSRLTMHGAADAALPIS